MPKLIAETEPQSGVQGFSGMRPGETRTVMLPMEYEGKGRANMATLEPFTMTRTSRLFIFDWVDAVSNEKLDRLGRKDIRWFVGEDGNAHLRQVRTSQRARA